MRWQWQILKVSSIWLFTIGCTTSAIVFIGMGNDMELLGRNDILILSAIAGWTFLLAFVHFMLVLSSSKLLQPATESTTYRLQPMLLALLLNLLVLAGWIIAGIIIVQAFQEAEPGAQTPALVKLFAYLLLLSIVIAIGNYLLAIRAYFELQHMRRKQQEDILHTIGNPFINQHG